MTKFKQFVFTDQGNAFHPFIVRALNEKHAKQRFQKFLEERGVEEALEDFDCFQAEAI